MGIKLSDFGFFRMGVASPELRVADIDFNVSEIIRCMDKAAESGCLFVLFPELSISSYTCADLFFQGTLQRNALQGLLKIAGHTAKLKSSAVVGLPVSVGNKLFNAAAFISNGDIKGIVPKTYIPNKDEFYEERWFSSEFDRSEDTITIGGKQVPFGADILFRNDDIPDCLIGIEICEDLWSLMPPSFEMAAAGATVLLNLSASNEILGKAGYRKQLVQSQSARCFAAYAYASSGPGESSTDLLFSGHSIIAEYGNILCETERFSFESRIAITDIDIERLTLERLKNNSYAISGRSREYRIMSFSHRQDKVEKILRNIPATPFVPGTHADRAETCREIFSIQTTALAKRLKHINAKTSVIGISGGLDSTLALLVLVKTFQKLSLDPSGIHAVTMPGFGTTNRTKTNAEKLSELLGLKLHVISINDSVSLHFKDIGHDPAIHDIVYENAQARERTQILMDISNQVNGIVIGTGDMSEYALGWCTYNADHISMYGVNSGIPKTLVKYMVEWCAEEEFSGETSDVLIDICATPISPELLPPDVNGEIIQETEKSIGPYILHDFFLYYAIRYHFSPAKVLVLAASAFGNEYEPEIVKKWLVHFYKRFFASQFKRSCFPDGVKVGTVALSPRGDWRMPSDASASLWLKELDKFVF